MKLNKRFINVPWTIIFIVLVYLITLGFLEKRGFWIMDNGNKFIQLQAILSSNYSDYSIPWPGQTLDPDFHFNPMPPPFSIIKDHKLYSIYSPIFALVSSFFFKICGFWGLYILPLVFSITMLFGIAKIVGIVGYTKAKPYAVLIAGLCTPLWFYSVVFWEHIIAVCLCIWGIAFCLQYLKSYSKKYLCYGAMLSTLSIYFRDELYIFCLVLLGAVLVYTREKRLKTAIIFISTILISIVPLWLVQWRTIGYPLGFHLGSHIFSVAGFAEHISDRPAVFYNLFVASSKNIWFSLTLTMPFIVTFLINPKFSTKVFKFVVPLYSLVALVSTILIMRCYFSSDSPILCMLHGNSLFVASPILILAFSRYKTSQEQNASMSLTKCVWLIAIAFAIVYGFTAPKLGSWGIHWGNRFLLVLYPLFAILCSINLAKWCSAFGRKIGWQLIVIAITIVISLGAQIYSINVLHKKKSFTYRLNQAIQKQTEEIIVTGIWGVPQTLHSQFYTKSIFYVSSPKRYRELIQKLSLQGHKKFLLLVRPSKKIKSAVVEVVDEGLHYFDLQFLTVDIPTIYSEIDENNF